MSRGQEEVGCMQQTSELFTRSTTISKLLMLQISLHLNYKYNIHIEVESTPKFVDEPNAHPHDQQCAK